MSTKPINPKPTPPRVRNSPEKRAKRLPPPLPGKIVIVPLELVPFYLKLHNRKIVSFRGDTAIIRPMAEETDGQHG
jgi:hypothetical protein